MSINLYRAFFFIGLLNLPGALGSLILNILFIAIYFAFFISALSSGKIVLFEKEKTKPLRIVFFYILLLFISYLRANEFSILKILNFLSFNLFLIVYLSEIISELKFSKSSASDAFRKYIMSPYIFYVALNLFCWIFDLKTDVKANNEVFIGQAVVLSNLGYSIERVNFLFSKGINGYSVLLGAIISYFTIDLIYSKKWSIINIGLYLALVISILLTDARSALAFPIIIFGICYVIYKFNIKIVIGLAALLFIAVPLVAVIFVPMLSEIEFFAQFSRSETDLFTLNGRLFIWLFALEEFINFKLIHLIGFGFEGHISSGASQKWAFLFTSYSEPDTVHPHNSILSIIFDLGYLGIITVVIMLNKIAQKLKKIFSQNKKSALTFFSVLLYLIFISITESFLTDLYMNGLTLILCYALFIISIETESIIETN